MKTLPRLTETCHLHILIKKFIYRKSIMLKQLFAEFVFVLGNFIS